MAVTVNIRSGADVDTVDDGEEFLTVLEWGTQLMCYQPDRDEYEFVGLSTDQVELQADEEERLGHDAAVYGDKSAWEETPLRGLFD